MKTNKKNLHKLFLLSKLLGLKCSNRMREALVKNKFYGNKLKKIMIGETSDDLKWISMIPKFQEDVFK